MPDPSVLIYRLIVAPLFIKSVAPDGVLRIRICTLGKAANRLIREYCFEGPCGVLAIRVS